MTKDTIISENCTPLASDPCNFLQLDPETETPISGADWIRLPSDWYRDPIIQSMSEIDQRRFLAALVVAYENRGDRITDDEMAHVIDIEEQDWVNTKRTLIARNLFTENNEPPDWGLYIKKSDCSTPRVRAWRKRKKLEIESAQKSQSDYMAEISETIKNEPCNVTESVPPVECNVAGNVSDHTQDINNLSTGLSTDIVDKVIQTEAAAKTISDCKIKKKKQVKPETLQGNITKSGGSIYINNNNIKNIYRDAVDQAVNKCASSAQKKYGIGRLRKPKPGQFLMRGDWAPGPGYLDLYIAVGHDKKLLNKITREFVAYWVDDDNNNPQTQEKWESMLDGQIKMKSKPWKATPKAATPKPADPPSYRVTPTATTPAKPRAATVQTVLKTPWPQAFKEFEKTSPGVVTEEARRSTKEAQAASMAQVRARLGMRQQRRAAAM